MKKEEPGPRQEERPESVGSREDQLHQAGTLLNRSGGMGRPAVKVWTPSRRAVLVISFLVFIVGCELIRSALMESEYAGLPQFILIPAGIGAVVTAWIAQRWPGSVVADAEGLVISGWRGHHPLAWDEIRSFRVVDRLNTGPELQVMAPDIITICLNTYTRDQRAAMIALLEHHCPRVPSQSGPVGG